jgi:hypothetical protein
MIANLTDVPVLRGFTEIRRIWDICQENDAYIAGGYVRYMVSERAEVAPAGDVDIYAGKKESMKLLDAFLALGYTLAGETNNAYTLDNPTEPPDRYKSLRFAPRAQIIKPEWVGDNLCDTLQQFDFTICMAGLINPDIATVHENFITDDLAGKLILHQVHDPVRTILRAMKYRAKGFLMQPSEVVKLLDAAYDDRQYGEWQAQREYWEDDDDWNENGEW